MNSILTLQSLRSPGRPTKFPHSLRSASFTRPSQSPPNHVQGCNPIRWIGRVSKVQGTTESRGQGIILKSLIFYLHVSVRLTFFSFHRLLFLTLDLVFVSPKLVSKLFITRHMYLSWPACSNTHGWTTGGGGGEDTQVPYVCYKWNRNHSTWGSWYVCIYRHIFSLSRCHLKNYHRSAIPRLCSIVMSTCFVTQKTVGFAQIDRGLEFGTGFLAEHVINTYAKRNKILIFKNVIHLPSYLQSCTFNFNAACNKRQKQE